MDLLVCSGPKAMLLSVPYVAVQSETAVCMHREKSHSIQWGLLPGHCQLLIEPFGIILFIYLKYLNTALS